MDNLSPGDDRSTLIALALILAPLWVVAVVFVAEALR